MKRQGICGTCGNQVGVNRHGLVVTHRGNFNDNRNGCPGSGQPERKVEEPFHTPGYDGPEGTEWQARPWSE